VALLELLRQDDARTPVTHAFLEEHRNLILDVVTEYNRNLRADLIQMAFEDPFGPTKPIAMSEEKALGVLKRASTLFVKKHSGSPMTTLYTYGGLIEDIRKEFRYDEFDAHFRYSGYNTYGWSDALLEKLGLDEDVTWDVVEAKQTEKPLVCLCGKPSFKQPASFIDLLSHVFEESEWRLENLRPTSLRFDDDHNTVDLSKLDKIIAQLDPKSGPSLDTLFERHKRKLIKQTKNNGALVPVYAHSRGYRCMDCDFHIVAMTRDIFQWHTLTKHLKILDVQERDIIQPCY